MIICTADICGKENYKFESLPQSVQEIWHFLVPLMELKNMYKICSCNRTQYATIEQKYLSILCIGIFNRSILVIVSFNRKILVIVSFK